MSTPGFLIFGYGNPGRGDDALGIALVEKFEQRNLPAVECLTDMQLQVEHVTDLRERKLALFIDADASCDAPFNFAEIRAAKDDSYSSHAMTPQALLHAYEQAYHEDAPRAFLMAIRGYDFELGNPISEQALINLEQAIEFCRGITP